ncbi:MAG: type II toxin-antitoxin system RelE/ParE family toxin [Longimicrobiales bacterium]
MDIEFDDNRLDRLETQADLTAGHGPAVDRAFRKVMQALRAALDERDLYKGGLRFEKLKGNRKGERSVRLNDQWRLLLEIRGKGSQKRIAVIRIEDYH